MVEQYQWYSILSLATSSTALVLAILVLRRHPGRRAAGTFVAAMSCFLLASLFAYLIRYGFNEAGGGAFLVWSARAFYFVHMLAVGLTAAFVGTYFYGFRVFRRRGAGTLLYFSLGAAAVFVSALVGETSVPYLGTVPSGRNATLALAAISTVYGVLMLGTVGNTLWRNRDPVVRRQATVMLVGILVHGATAEAYAYFRLSGDFPAPFLTASALLMAATFAFAVLRLRMFEVAPRREEPAPLPQKFPLNPGRAYFVRERTADAAFRALAEAARRDRPCLLVTRRPPDAVRQDHDLENTPVIWLTATAGYNHVPPTDCGLLVRLVRSFADRAERPVVAMEGLEYLAEYVGFDRAIRAVQAMRDSVTGRGGSFLLAANPGAFDEPQLALLDREFEALQLPAHAVVEDVFVIHKSGLLLAHEARRLKPETDRDIMASMLTAILNFARVSFAEGSEELRRLELGEKKVLIEQGDQIILAVVYRGPQPDEVDAEMRAFLWRAERRFGALLARWSGDVEQVGGLRAMTARLFL